MFSLLSGLWKYLSSKAEFHVLILGIDKAGKTVCRPADADMLPNFCKPILRASHGLAFRVEAYKSILNFWDLGAKILRHEDLAGAPVLIFANKHDVQGALNAEDLARCLGSKELSERASMIKATSAYDGFSVKDGIMWLAENVRKSKRLEQYN